MTAKKIAARSLFRAGRYLEAQLPTEMAAGSMRQFSLTAALCILANAYNQVLGVHHVPGNQSR